MITNNQQSTSWFRILSKVSVFLEQSKFDCLYYLYLSYHCLFNLYQKFDLHNDYR
jgi:hypothetical protein